jgi:predicted nicotinamide N-methyase
MAAADAVRGGDRVADIPCEAIAIDVAGCRVSLCRATGLERFVDREALLRADAPAEPPYWMHLWPGARTAARLLAGAVEVRPGARVLELGCGLALPALVAARRGAAVVACDWQRAALEFARRSAARNRCAVALVQMDWRAPALRRAGFDVCVGADIGYDLAAESALASGLAHLVAPRGVAWLADSVNTARGGLAERLGAAGFAVAVREEREWEEGRPVWVRVIAARRCG